MTKWSDEKMKCEFLNTQQVADEFFNGVFDNQKVLRMVRKGILPAVKIGKGYVYRKEALEAWAEKNFSCPAWSKIKS